MGATRRSLVEGEAQASQQDSRRSYNMAMGQNPSYPPVNIRIQPLKLTKMGSAPTPKWYPWF